VVRLVRGPAAPGEITWDPAGGVRDADALAGCAAVVHLAGETLDQRWTAGARARILESRARGTRTLADAIAALRRPPRAFITASAIGYYGSRGEESVDETAPPGSGFLADVVRAWEDAAAPAASRGVRVVRLRTGLVLARRGGVLPRLALPFRMGLGGALGDGRQWVSWITLEDLVEVIVRAVGDPALSGPVNAVTPVAVTQRDLARALGRVLGSPCWLPAPAFVLRALLGRDFADALVLGGARVVPAVLARERFAYRHAGLEPALRSLLR
jgi:hypothetical protein